MKNKSKRTNFIKNDEEDQNRHSTSSKRIRERPVDEISPSTKKNVENEISENCSKEKFHLKKQKLLKRDLLRCDDRKNFSFLQSAKSPRTSLSRSEITTNRNDFGPWSEISFCFSKTNRKEVFRPLKTTNFLPFRDLNESSNKNLFQSSIETTIEDYRRQKGYLIDHRTKTESSTVASTEIEEKNFSPMNNERQKFFSLNTELFHFNHRIPRSFVENFEHSNKTPSIPSTIRFQSEIGNVQSLPVINMRNGHLRPARQNFHQTFFNQTTNILPSLAGSAISHLNNPEKNLNNSTKTNLNVSSKLYFIQGRQKKKTSGRSSIDSAIERRPLDYASLCATGSPVLRHEQRAASSVVCQFPRRLTTVNS